MSGQLADDGGGGPPVIIRGPTRRRPVRDTLARRRPRRPGRYFRAASILWLTAVWVLLWGDLSVANVLGGLATAVVIGLTFPMASVDFHGRPHLVPVVHLAYRFVVDLVVASVQVVGLALDPRRTPRCAVLAVQLRSHSDLYLTLTAELCTLVPGSLVVEARRTAGVLYVHVLDVDSVGGIDAARRHVLETEERVLRALASDAELAEAGLIRSRRVPAAGPSAGPEVPR